MASTPSPRAGVKHRPHIDDALAAKADAAKAAGPEKLRIAFPLGDKLIDGAVVKRLSFQQFSDMIVEAREMRAPKTFEGRLKRLRMVKQVVYYTNGSTAPMTQEDVLKMPIPAAQLIGANLDKDEGKAGKVVRQGDGIDQAVVFELGTPIPVQGKEPIRELEFFAKTFGDIEDVLAAPDSITQAAILIATIAKPLGTSLTLLPSWALSQISVADGVTIAREILPVFLGPAPE